MSVSSSAFVFPICAREEEGRDESINYAESFISAIPKASR